MLYLALLVATAAGQISQIIVGQFFLLDRFNNRGFLLIYFFVHGNSLLLEQLIVNVFPPAP
jgi:hypothetical protein